MATLNELGRNSAAITYGPSSLGADSWPTLTLWDQWLRNDTLQGTATASSTTVTGVGSVYLTQLRAGDVVLIAGQQRTVASVASDTSFSVTVAFSPAITVASAVKFINTTLTGTAGATVRQSTNGTVSVVSGLTQVVGTGTYFLSDMTSAVTTGSAMAGTISIDVSGNVTGSGTSFLTGASANQLQPGDCLWINTATTSYLVVASVVSDTTATVVTAPSGAISGGTYAKATNGVIGRYISINGRFRQVTSIENNTSMYVNAAWDFTDSGMKVKTFPRGTVAVSAGTSNVTGSNTNFFWDFVSGDQVWFGDELRTMTFSSPTVATITDYSGYSGTAIGVLRQGFSGLPLHREDTYITGSGTAFLTELRVGDDLIINGTECTVTQILSNTLMRVNIDWTHTISGQTIYKKRKVHGWILEGTREGSGSAGKFTTSDSMLITANTFAIAGTNTITLNNASSFNQYAFVKIQGAGGPPVALSGQINTVSGSTTITGVNTLFTSQLHVGAEICIAGQYFTVTAIASDTSLTVNASMSVTGPTPIYRTTPLYTYIASKVSNTLTLGTTIKNTLTSTGANPPLVYTPSAATDFLEYVYSAPNKTAEASVTLFNTSLDRKYMGVRFYPLATGGGSGNTLATAGAAYNTTVYERWTATHAQTNGVGINQADRSGNTDALSGVTDITSCYQTTGGFLYLFAKPRYFIVQGKSFSNLFQPWVGCVEFERAQPEDTGTGLGVSTGISFATAPTTTTALSGTPAIAPWPCFAYFHSNRFPLGSEQTPTAPVNFTTGHAVHGGIFAVPRIRSSTGDLVGLNAHVYSAATITTGRWGHLYDLRAGGSYNDPTTAIAGGAITATANTVPQPHLGHLVPVNTNIYNAKRFMFSPVVVLGPSYDPDIRGRIYGLKIIPAGLGTLMDTVSVTIDSNDFYDSTQSAQDHWVVTVANQSSGLPSILTYRFYLNSNLAPQAYRSIEDVGAATSANTKTTFANNFRFAIPA